MQPGRRRPRDGLQRPNRRGGVRSGRIGAAPRAAHRDCCARGVCDRDRAARGLLGDSPDFEVHSLPSVEVRALPLFYLLGAVAALLAVVYNRLLLATIAAVGRVPMSVEARAGLIGGAVGALAWFRPGLVGGGDVITQSTLNGGAGSLEIVALVFLLRLCLGAVSYAAATPGGLFAPMLVLGAQSVFCSAARVGWRSRRSTYRSNPSPSWAWRHSSPASCVHL